MRGLTVQLRSLALNVATSYVTRAYSRPRYFIPESPRFAVRIPKYRFHRTSGNGFVEWRGKRHYLGPYHDPSTKLAYRQFLERHVLATVASAPNNLPPMQSDTVAGVFLLWLRAHKDRYHERSFDHFRTLARIANGMFADLDVNKFSPLRLKELRTSLADSGATRRHVNTQVFRFRQVFRWGVSEEIVRPEVLAALESVDSLRRGESKAKESAPVEPVPPEVVSATTPFLTPVVATMVRLQQLTGMRSEELATMRAVDIERSSPVWRYSPQQHKSSWRGKVRTIPLGPQSQLLLTPYLDRPAEAFLFSPAESIKQHRTSRRASSKSPRRPKASKKAHRKKQPAERYTSYSYRRAIAYGIKQANKAGVDAPSWHPHQLRHSHATEVRRRFGLEAAQVALGHSNANVTQLYAERDLALAMRIAEEIG